MQGVSLSVPFCHGTSFWCTRAYQSGFHVENKSPDNCITVRPVRFFKYMLNPRCQALKSSAGRESELGVTKARRLGGCDFSWGEWTFKCIFIHSQGVHSVPHESIISSVPQTRDTIIHPEEAHLSQWCLKNWIRCQV